MKTEFRSVLFLGIGGVSMYQLACAFKKMGIIVFGYDAKNNQYVEYCRKKGIIVANKFLSEFINVDLCVKTAAIGDDNKYVQHLKKIKIKIVDRAVALGWLCSKFKTVIAVAGTHGKSTTSTLIYEMLRQSGKKVSSHIGADVLFPRFEIGDDYLVLEACEYKKSFLSIYPNISVVTNIEAEHMDCYQNIFNLRSAFVSFLKRADKRFVYLDDSTAFLKRYPNINFVTMNKYVDTKLHGEYNQKNIALAIAVAKSLGIDEDNIYNTVAQFTGVSRRYEGIGIYNTSRIFIDYAHHPTEVRAFISTFLSDYNNSLVIFQPHTYSRTKMFIKDFVDVLGNIKNIIIYKEYPAREDKSQGMTAKELYHEIKKINPSVKYCASYKSVKKNIEGFDAVAFVGAGDINAVAKKIIKSN